MIRTWQLEWAVVVTVLTAVNLVTKAAPTEWIGAIAVLLTFGHASISDRMAEKQARMEKPDVDCYRWSVRYYLGKELLWVVYFILHHSYAALVGCAVFLIYPLWRRWYRKRRPIDRATTPRQ